MDVKCLARQNRNCLESKSMLVQYVLPMFEHKITILLRTPGFVFCFVFFALCTKSTAMVMAGWSVDLTTLFPGQA